MSRDSDSRLSRRIATVMFLRPSRLISTWSSSSTRLALRRFGSIGAGPCRLSRRPDGLLTLNGFDQT
jgi:hypothetical protein